MERVTGVGAVEEHRRAQFDRTPGGSTTWAVFERDSNHLGRPDRVELWQPPDGN